MVAEYDILIKDTMIVNGTGLPAYKGSIGISGDKICALGVLKGGAERVIDGKGLITTPGFIDAHSHADLMLNWYPKCESYIMQGVTTFVGGLCGDSPAPLGEFLYIPFLYLPLQQHFFQFFKYKYYPNDIYPMEKVNEWMMEKYGWRIEWRSMGGFFDAIRRMEITMNYVPFVGHCTIRQAVMGSEAKREATDYEVDQMVELLDEAMEEGCVGLSTGVDYDPGTYASRDEINRLVATLKKYEGLYSTHWRRTGRRRDWDVGHKYANPIQGITDELDTAKLTGVKIQLSHLSAGYHVSPPPPSNLMKAVANETLAAIDKYIEAGVDVHFDVIPSSPAWNTMPFLCGLLDPWLREVGGRENLGEWLKSPEYRKEIKDALMAGKWWIREAYNPTVNAYWATNVKVVRHRNTVYNGKTVAQISEENGKEHLETYFDLIVEDPDSRGALLGGTNISNDLVEVFYKHPRSMVGVDTFVYDDKYQQETPPYNVPAFNTYSAYPSFLKRFVDENNVLSLEEAVKRCTYLPAKAHLIKGRGEIKEGNYADLTVIDWDNMRTHGNEFEPRRYPSGFDYVIVNGQIVVEKGSITGALPGKILTRD